MKIAATLTALVLGLSVAGLANADSTTGLVSADQFPLYPTIDTPSTMTRAQVLQQLHQAEAVNGVELQGQQPFYPNEAAPASHLTRANVLAELHAAQARGDVIQENQQAFYPATPNA